MILIVAIFTRNATKFSVNKFIINIICFTLKCLLPLKQQKLRYSRKNTRLGVRNLEFCSGLHQQPGAYRWGGRFSPLSLTTHLLAND